MSAVGAVGPRGTMRLSTGAFTRRLGSLQRGCLALRSTAAVAMLVSCALAGGVGAGPAAAAPVELRGLGLGGELQNTQLVTHQGVAYAAAVNIGGSVGGERRELYVSRWVDGHWQRVGGLLNDRADAEAWNPSLLSVDGMLYVAWTEVRPGDMGGRLMLARLREEPGAGRRWEPVARATAPRTARPGITRRMVALDGRPAVTFWSENHEGAVAVVIDGHWKTWRLADLVGPVEVEHVTGYGNTLNALQQYWVTIPAHTGQHGYVPARTQYRWRLNRVAFGADGGFTRLHPIELPAATNSRSSVTVDQGGTQPLFTWRGDREIVVAELDAEATDVQVIARIRIEQVYGHPVVTRLDDGVAVAAVTRDARLRVYRIRRSADGPRIESDSAAIARNSAVELTGGRDGQVVVSAQQGVTPVVLAFGFNP